MPTLTESNHVAEWLLSEQDGTGDYNRELVTVTQGTAMLASGTLLGKITATGKFIPYLNGAVDGSQAVAAILYSELPARASGGDVKAAVLVRGPAVVFGTRLTGSDAPGLVDLAALNIVVRT